LTLDELQLVFSFNNDGFRGYTASRPSGDRNTNNSESKRKGDMRKNGKRLIVAVTVGFLLETAYAQKSEGPYLNVEAGAAFVQDVSGSFDGVAGSARFDPGFRLSLCPGLTLYRNKRYEAAVQFETGFIYNSWNSVEVQGTRFSTSGGLWQVPFLADIVYGFDLSSKFKAYVGAGGGGLYNSTTLDSLEGIAVNASSSETDWAAQGLARLNYKLSERSELGLSYKFLTFFPDGVDYVGTHTISLGYTIRF
jgi:hypothetical protein